MPAVLIGNSHSFIRMEQARNIAIEQSEFYHGGFHLIVEVQSEGFAGINHQIWFELDELTSFLTQLKSLEATRQGSATLRTQIPEPYNELELKLYSVDRAGHISAEVLLKNHKYVGSENKPFSVFAAFEVDNLPTVVKELQEFLRTLIS